jgi:hypothetical protein
VTAPVKLAPASEAEARLFRLLRDVSVAFRGLPWTLVGGLMVRILEVEGGRPTHQSTVDIDTLLDVRAAATATREASDKLLLMGFVPDLMEDSVAYRFTKDDAIVDVLAPEGLGAHASTITVPPAETIRAVGGTQALNRTRSLLVDDGEGAFEVPMPSLLGAIVIKARVARVVREADSRAKHERDLARLLALVDDPYAMSEEMSRSDRRYLRAHGALRSSAHPAWRGFADARNGVLALTILMDQVD